VEITLVTVDGEEPLVLELNHRWACSDVFPRSDERHTGRRVERFLRPDRVCVFCRSGAGGADGPDRVFVGGLPYYLTEDQIKELLSSFG
jgi:hypothetical protein